MKGVIQHWKHIKSIPLRQSAQNSHTWIRSRLKNTSPQKWLIVAALVLAVTGISVIALWLQKTLAFGTTSLPTLSQLNRGVTIFDKNDKYVCTLRADADRKAIPLSKISPHMRNAIVAAEDRRFYSHKGVDLQGIARAFYKNHQAGRIVEGGSTITQQLVKNLYCDKTDRSYGRKLKEARMALDVELRYPKEQILETYLNIVYFGGGVCGIERAAQYYFNKPAANLNPTESAWLAGLVKAPSDLSVRSSKAALARQREILVAMGECGFLTPENVSRATQAKLAFKKGPLSRPWPHYIGCVEEVLKTELGDDLWKGGWKVYTNLDVNAQKLAESVINNGIKNAPKGIDQGALVTMSLKDGAVHAIVGGAGAYENVQWNRAVHPHTAGSTFKPFVYLAALTQGIVQPDTMINDAPLKIEVPNGKPYEPENFDGRFAGWVTTRSALAASRNVCSVRVAQETGLGQVVDTARAAGIRSQLDAYPSLALGACAVSPMDMATAYATIARGGVYMAPQIVRRIDTEAGKMYRTYHATPSANLASEPTLQLLDVLQDVVRCGTGTRARIPGVAVAGKTGTSNDSKDIWFVGSTPETLTAVWAGNDLNKKVRGVRVTGGVVMAKIWHDYMSGYLKSHPPRALAFAKPAKPLINEIPQYAENQLFYEQIATNDPEVQPQLSAVELASRVTNVPDLEKASNVGIARAYDLQKLAAIKRLQNTYVASAGESNGVTNYAYDRYGNYVATPANVRQDAFNNSVRSVPAQPLTQPYRELPVSTSVWNSARRQQTDSYLSHGRSVSYQADTRRVSSSNHSTPSYQDADSASISRSESQTERLLNVNDTATDQSDDSSVIQARETGGVIYVR